MAETSYAGICRDHPGEAPTDSADDGLSEACGLRVFQEKDFFFS